ncbi:MAG: chromosome segregation protein SMC [Pelovirga sp.]
MRIKRLDIFGFKSFVDKVSLDFEPGITGIVGPNGCGKSNILDAVRWVMGEQNVRHLRGRSMEDVIFGGSETRKPTGLAQVSMVLDNSDGNCPAAYRDFAEIMVTRKLYRSGESDYLINKTPCRLLDINELFMDTGVGARAYSIIEQGKVGALVSAKPEERRALIEEAAGVTKFKSRKKHALRKMDATRQNLIRLGDIITEVRRQISSLQRQAGKAEQFRELRREARQLELSLSGNRLQRLDAEIALLAERERSDAAALERLDLRLAEGEVRQEERQLQLSGAESDYNQAQQRDYQLGADIQRLESESDLLQREQEQLTDQQQQTGTELDQCEQRLGELAAEAAALLVQQRDAAGGLDELRILLAAGEADQAQARERERQANERFEACRQELMEQFARASRLQNRHEEIGRRLDVEEQRRRQIETERNQIELRQADLTRQQEQLAERRAAVAAQQDHLRSRRDAVQEELQVRRNLLARQQAAWEEGRRQLEQTRSRHESLDDLQRNREGCGEGTRALLAADAGRRIAADLLRVSAADEVAVENALGERLQAIPIDLPQELPASLALLEQQQVRGMLLIKQQHSPAPAFPGGIPLIDRISCVAGAEDLVRQLLAGVFLVDAVADHLTAVLAPGVLLIDRHGHCLDWQGVMTGGASQQTAGGLLRRQRQLEDLAAQIAAAQESLAAEQRELEQCQELLQQTEEEQAQVQAGLHRHELQALELGKDEQSLTGEQEHLERRLALLHFDLGQIEESREGLLHEQKECLTGGQGALKRQQQLEEQAQQLQRDLSRLRDELDASREALTRQRVELASLQQQQQGVTETLERISRQQGELTARREQLVQRRSSQAAARERNTGRSAELRTLLEAQLDLRVRQQRQTQSLQEAYLEQRTALDEFREQLRRLRTEAEDLRKTVARLQLRQREQELEAEHLLQGVEERFAIDLRAHQVPQATDDELERQQHQLQRLQQKITALGEVNLMAIEEYQEQEKRYDFLIRERDDLKQSLDDLEKAILQINRTTRRRFKETFDQANEQFRQVFPRLFRGGQAELRLTDENDLLETGIDIIVQPPGKRLQNVNLLSGGEKALTAVALIFSLFLLKPTPFCVLDEVDAPLDDANIDRFAELVREMTDRSQFILITHSKRTMEIVNTLYGVTMQEPGVSRLVSVRVNDLLPAHNGRGATLAAAAAPG